jgi:hypothetical protein
LELAFGGVDGASVFSPLDLGFSRAMDDPTPETARLPLGFAEDGGSLNMEDRDGFDAKVGDFTDFCVYVGFTFTVCEEYFDESTPLVSLG